MLFFIFQGLVIGVCVAAPVGPVGILCIRRVLHRGRVAGAVSGLGVAIGDVIFAAIAAFSITYIIDFLLEQQFWIKLVGGAVLLWLGWHVAHSHPHLEKNSEDSGETGVSVVRRFFLDISSTVFMTLTNPSMIIGFIALFAGLGLDKFVDDNADVAIYLVIGVFLGSMLWWIILAEIVVRLRQKITDQTLTRINHVSGILIGLFGMVAWGSLFI